MVNKNETQKTKNIQPKKKNKRMSDERTPKQNKFFRPPTGQKKTPMMPYNRGPLSWLLLSVVLITIMMAFNNWKNKVEVIDLSKFYENLDANNVTAVELGDGELVGQFTKEAQKARPEGAPVAFSVITRESNDKVILEKLEEARKRSGLQYKYGRPQMWLPFLLNWGSLIVFGLLFYFLFLRNLRGAGGMLSNFGRSKHRVHGKEQSNVNFKDVAGIDEAKDEVTEIIEFLKNPKKFQRLGGRIPRGVLLVGPPGCGKTLLAKAIAGEAEVPFFSISGSDFVEMFVGVGASRVRDLFKQAKENSPCIIFLDEIDAIGRKRGPGFASGGHDEREQTLNAILVEMDGFDTNDQVIMIAATNRADILDQALTRPGRFDRQIFVPLPDVKGRAEILKVHSRKVKMSPNVDIERVARQTPMFSGAELAAIINEAAIGATMANKDFVETSDLEEARDKVRWGRAKRSRVIDKKEKELTAYHEAGHTLVQSLIEDADPLHKVSIIPRGPMGGATFSLPEKDRTIFTRKYCMAMIQVCFGGRIAEDLVFNDISSGASSDIMQATDIAKKMILNWGMSDRLGPINYGDAAGRDMMYGMGLEKDYSDKTAESIDDEVKSITDIAYKNAKEVIAANRDKLDAIAAALLKYETLDAEEVKTLLAGGKLDKPTVSELLAVEQEKNGAEKNSNGSNDNASVSGATA
jgi:cell division protease FtsH